MKLQFARAGFKADIRKFLPTLSLTFGGSDSVALNGTDTYSKQFSVKLNQLITTGGRNYSERTIEKINLLLQKKQLEEQKYNLQDHVWKAFYELLLNREKLKLQKSALDISKDQLKIAELEKKQGSITELELLETKIEVKNLEVQIADTKLGIKRLEYNLNKLLGFKQLKSLILKGEDLREYRGIDIGNFTNSTGRLYTTALNRSLEIKTLNFELTKSKMQLDLIKRRFIPTINAELSFSLSGNDFPLQEAHYGIGLNISLPYTGTPLNFSLNYSGDTSGGRSRSGSSGVTPFENIKVYLNEKQGELAVRDARERLGQFKDELKFKIGQAVDSYASLRRKVVLKRESLALGTRRITILKKRLDIGEIKRLDYLKEQIQLSEDRIDYLNDVFSLLMAERNIEKLVGLAPGMLKRYFAHAVVNVTRAVGGGSINGGK